MNYKNLKIKICGIKYDVKEISELNPDFIGFIFYSKSPRFVGYNFFIPLLKNKPIKTGIFVNENPKNIFKIYIEKKLDYVQLHGNESPYVCEFLFKKKVKIIKSFKVNDLFSMKKTLNYVPFCSYFLFDNNGGSGKKFRWEKLQEYNFTTPFFLSGGIGIKDLKKIKKFYHSKIFGIDINSKFELYPGKKNKQMLKEFMKKIREI
ncbi:phosphoribosylanthranilate isomerase [Blattabacterium cuenoti]|uniref:phosphoribosylanthranilate isomerase n=1 Tax=Blattabacterium cuenoti TaxID=1653831 RepID=UPI00163CD33B|nr:phosphoribosylanthranilate isomerase [Blattabacterium cuenoti]